MSQNNLPSTQITMLNTINEVAGFDPAAFAVEYCDLSTGETRKRLPVMAQIAWFRLKHPEGKFAITVESEKDFFVASAKVYASYKDPADWYLSEATASRKYDPLKPTVSPREWAQTAALGIALRNAGFGLQFSAAGDGFDAQVPDELGVSISASINNTPGTPPVPAEPAAPQGPATPPESTVPEREPEIVVLTPEQRFQQACAMVSPIKKHAGKTLGEVLTLEPRAINWLATKYSGDEQIKAAAEFICSYSVEQASA